jgi:hypothetical protein
MKSYRYLLRLQGIFYFITGLWPQIHIRSFMQVTGPKDDIWLVKTVGLTIVACSIGLFLASFRKFVQPDVIVTGLGFAFFLTAADIYYYLTGVISPVYLADAAAEILLISAWFWLWRSSRKKEILVQKN